MWHWMKNWDAHHRLAVAAMVAAAMGTFSYEHWPKAVLWVAIWNAFALVLVLLSWVQIATTGEKRMLDAAERQDFSSVAIFVFVIATCFISLFAVGYLLGSGRPSDRPLEIAHTLVSILTVGSSWLLIHTLFALHYAHLYHGLRDRTRQGVLIPGTKSPDYFDFAYLSFSIGTGYQPGDVKVVSPYLRRLVMVHGLISFIFNTAIVALGVGCVTTVVIG